MTQLAQRIDGIPVVADSTTRDARYPAASRAVGQRVHRLDANVIERWTGAAWTTDFLGAVASETWVNPTLLNAWVVALSRTVSYYKGRDGVVRLRGAVKSGASGTIAFTLPSGYRPTTVLGIGVVGFFDAAVVLTDGSYIEVGPGGDVTVFLGGGSQNAISLDNVSFLAA